MLIWLVKVDVLVNNAGLPGKINYAPWDHNNCKSIT